MSSVWRNLLRSSGPRLVWVVLVSYLLVFAVQTSHSATLDCDDASGELGIRCAGGPCHLPHHDHHGDDRSSHPPHDHASCGICQSTLASPAPAARATIAAPTWTGSRPGETALALPFLRTSAEKARGPPTRAA